MFSGPDSKKLKPGEVFAGRYLVDHPLGEGGMSIVYRARDQVTNKDVALKFIRPDRALTPGAIEHLVVEGTAAREIRSDYVVSVYDVAKSGSVPYISMEVLEGETLRQWMRTRIAKGEECSFRTAGQIILSICEGLQAAHARQVIHRDLKPENVFLLADPLAETPEVDPVRLKLLDFGLAVVGSGLTSARASAGTPIYMAPELKTSQGGVAADIYSLSVIFYELLTEAIPHGAPHPASDGRKDVPKLVDALILEGLSTNWRNRPKSVADYRQRLLVAMPAPVAKPSPAPRPTPQSEPGVETVKKSEAAISPALRTPPDKRDTDVGRIGQVEYFGGSLVLLFFGFLIGAIAWVATGGGDPPGTGDPVSFILTFLREWLSWLQGAAGWLIWAFVAAMLAVFTAQRLHDIDRSLWYALVVMPLYPVAMPILASIKSHPGVNRFGEPPAS